MKEKDFYDITNIIESSEKDNFSVTVSLNSNHQIFSGHFPGNPVLPGVCIIQMIKEILSKLMEKDLALVKSNSIKYLNIINPVVHPSINLEIKIKSKVDGVIQINCMVSFENSNFCNFSGEFC